MEAEKIGRSELLELEHCAFPTVGVAVLASGDGALSMAYHRAPSGTANSRSISTPGRC